MIGSLRGRLTAKHPPVLLIEVNGIGYEVHAPMPTIYQLPALQQEVFLYIHHLVREDAQQLFGFSSDEERQLFRSLLRINGVGAKMALGILSGMSVDELSQCVRDGDAARLTRIPGVGNKTAQRLLVELRDRLPDWSGADGTTTLPATSTPAVADPVADAISGLVALGYKPQEASRYVHAIDGRDKRSEDIIREVLKSLVRA
jgi:Holliday junction DNA helicase RuvA